MSTWIDFDTYVFMGGRLDEAEFNKIVIPCMDLITIFVDFKIINSADILIHKALFYQIEFTSANGGVDHIFAGGTLDNVTLGSFSYGSSNQNVDKTNVSDLISPMTMRYLHQTGLTYRGVVGYY